MSLNSGLVFKWLKSENASSAETKWIAKKTRNYLGLTARQYRKMLSYCREKTKVLERLMSTNQWDKIDFSKIPSKAGLIYKNAFARRDIIKEKYKAFAEDKNTTVNAKTLYPFDVTKQAMAFGDWGYYYGNGNKSQSLNDTERLMVNKYWENLEDFFNGCSFNGICVADTSGSMYGTPMAVALSIAMYCAERNTGPFANHFFTFSERPSLVKIEGIDFVDKVCRMGKADWGNNTNIEAVFDKMLDIAVKNRLTQDDIPQNIIVVSDMEFDYCVTSVRYADRQSYGWYHKSYEPANETVFEAIEKKWNSHGYKMPNLVFWNVDARQDNIPMKVSGHVSYVSGFSPVIFEQVLKGVTAYDLMYDKLDSERYAPIG